MARNALVLEFCSAAQLSKRPSSVWKCLWGHALKRSIEINRKSKVLYPGPGFLSSATWPSLPKKHYNGLINQSIYLFLPSHLCLCPFTLYPFPKINHCISLSVYIFVYFLSLISSFPISLFLYICLYHCFVSVFVGLSNHLFLSKYRSVAISIYCICIFLFMSYFVEPSRVQLSGS